jgi:putative transposase
LPRPERRSPRLRSYDYAHVGAYFVTVCTAKRACIFGVIAGDRMQLNRAGLVVEGEWLAIPARWRDVAIDAFVVMPNHIHGIVWLMRAGQAPPLPTLIGSFKSGVSRQLGRPVWQRSFYDRVIRNDAELQTHRQYIADNPIR